MGDVPTGDPSGMDAGLAKTGAIIGTFETSRLRRRRWLGWFAWPESGERDAVTRGGCILLLCIETDESDSSAKNLWLIMPISATLYPILRELNLDTRGSLDVCCGNRRMQRLSQ
jgi:hypothetical protein